MSSALRAFVALAAVVVVAGCATTPGLNVVSYEPTALLEPQGADRLVLVDGEGRSSARGVVADLFVGAARGGFFHIEDRGRSGIKLTLAGDRATISGARGEPNPNELWVRIDVLAWDADPITMLVREDGEDVEVPGWRGRADLQFTVANANGDILVRERELRGVHDDDIPDPRRSEAYREQAIISAANDAVRTFLIEITPFRRTQFLAFDDGDNGQTRIITDTKDTLEGLEKRLRRYLAKNPGNAIAHHNLGVVLDAQGRYEEALIEHDRALDIVPREGFFDARSETARRRIMWERMYGPRPAPRTVAPDAEPAPSTSTPPETTNPVAVERAPTETGTIESSGATAPPVP